MRISCVFKRIPFQSEWSRKSVILDQETLSFVPGWSNTPKPSSMPSALAVFTCRPNSHPFQERHVYLDEPVKIGRSVARCRPAQNNATFDCKVLSRNHALIWFDHKTGKVSHTIVSFVSDLPLYVNRFNKQCADLPTRVLKYEQKSKLFYRCSVLRCCQLDHVLRSDDMVQTS